MLKQENYEATVTITLSNGKKAYLQSTVINGKTYNTYEVNYEDYPLFMATLDTNTYTTPYRINIYNLVRNYFIASASESSAIATMIDTAERYVYINLAEYTDESAMYYTAMKYSFANCQYIVGVTNFSKYVQRLDYCFLNCVNFSSDIIIPEKTSSLEGCFCGCTKFNNSVIFNNTYQIYSLDSAFEDCQHFNQKITLPKNFASYQPFYTMNRTFANCYDFSQEIEIPDFVQELKSCFVNCTSLKSIIFNSVITSDMIYCLKNCTSLEKITVKTKSNQHTSDKWHYVRIDNSDDTNVSYQIYEEGSEFDSDGNLSPKYSGTFERTGNNYELPIATDELIFDTNAPLTDETVKQHLKYKLPFYKNALDPSKENFVLWGANSETFRTNLNISSTFPIGFVYTQYSGTPNPNTLALSVPTGCHWEDITTNYNGEFFRAYKSGTSSEFSESEIVEQAYQTELPSHNHNASGSSASAGNHTHGIRIGTGTVSSNWSLVARSTAYENWDQMWRSGSHTHTISVSTNATSISQETRPINSSIKIWQVQKDTTE